MRRSLSISLLTLMAFLLFYAPSAVQAQEATPTSTVPQLTLYTLYPSQVVGVGETVTFSLKLSVTNSPQTVKLEMKQVPDGWTATFRGGGNIIQSAYIQPGTDSTVDLRLDQPTGVKAGTYDFVVTATGQNLQTQLPLEVVIKEKLPPRISLTTDLPTLKGTPSTTFRYNVTLKNEGDEDLTVNLVAQAPNDFTTSFTLAGQDVTSIPVTAGGTKSLSVAVAPVGTVSAGTYPINIQAQGGNAQASLSLSAEVTGQSTLDVTSPDGNLKGNAYIGKDTPLKVTIRNTGSAPAQGIALSSSDPTGWNVTFSPNQIAEIPAGQQVDVTANIHPADNAVAGDYMVTVTAKPADGASKSTDFRITVLTSTLWGVAGIGIIAVSLGVVALAVLRFGRR